MGRGFYIGDDDIGMSFWEPWSRCYGKCGKGFRLRSCKYFVYYGVCPSKGRGITEKEECDTGIPCVPESGWGEWGTWGKWNCSATCGGGLGIRRRVCVNRSSSDECPGLPVQVSRCNKTPCPIPPMPEAIKSELQNNLEESRESIIEKEGDDVHIKISLKSLERVSKLYPKTSYVFWVKNGEALLVDPSRMKATATKIYLFGIRPRDSGVHVAYMNYSANYDPEPITIKSLAVIPRVPQFSVHAGESIKVTCNGYFVAQVFMNKTYVQKWIVKDMVIKQYSHGTLKKHNVDTLTTKSDYTGIWTCEVSNLNNPEERWVTNAYNVKVLPALDWFSDMIIHNPNMLAALISIILLTILLIIWFFAYKITETKKEADEELRRILDIMEHDESVTESDYLPESPSLSKTTRRDETQTEATSRETSEVETEKDDAAAKTEYFTMESEKDVGKMKERDEDKEITPEALKESEVSDVEALSEVSSEATPLIKAEEEAKPTVTEDKKFAHKLKENVGKIRTIFQRLFQRQEDKTEQVKLLEEPRQISDVESLEESSFSKDETLPETVPDMSSFSGISESRATRLSKIPFKTERSTTDSLLSSKVDSVSFSPDTTHDEISDLEKGGRISKTKQKDEHELPSPPRYREERTADGVSQSELSQETVRERSIKEDDEQKRRTRSRSKSESMATEESETRREESSAIQETSDTQSRPTDSSRLGSRWEKIKGKYYYFPLGESTKRKSDSESDYCESEPDEESELL